MINMKTKRFVLLKVWCCTLFSLMLSLSAKAQYETTLTIKDATAGMPRQAIESNASRLLTEFNNAQGEKRALLLQNINIDTTAVKSLHALWEVCPFRCDELEVVEICSKLLHNSNYQVRKIPVVMEPRSGEVFNEDRYQEIVLNFDNEGKIDNIYFALEAGLVRDVLDGRGREVQDMRKRSLILEFVEQFRTAYNRKDTAYLNNVFSDNALIITGKVVTRTNSDGKIGLKRDKDVEYVTQSKNQYISRLKNVFKINQRINVVFDEIKINAHRTKENIYGVKLVQHWHSGSYNGKDSYSDKGYLFLLWDFADENEPKIHVRTWQPYDETPKEKVFELADFKFDK